VYNRKTKNFEGEYMKKSIFVILLIFGLFLVGCDNGNGLGNGNNETEGITVSYNSYKVEIIGSKSNTYYGMRVYFNLNWTSVSGRTDPYKITVNRGTDTSNYIIYEGTGLTTNEGSPGSHVEDIDIKSQYYTNPYFCTYKAYTYTNTGYVEGKIRVRYTIKMDGVTSTVTGVDVDIVN
jgi:hypothetical protein